MTRKLRVNLCGAGGGINSRRNKQPQNKQPQNKQPVGDVCVRITLMSAIE
jgi:hypothetical protein